MAAFQISWTIEGETQLSRVLLGMEADMHDLSRPFKQSADYLKHTFAVDAFDTQGAVLGERWKRLSPVTVARKARLGMPDIPLIGSGNMRASFYTDVGTDYAIVGNTAPYFAYHQSNRPRSKIPRRVMMNLTNSLKEQVVRYFQEHIRLSMQRP